MKSTVKFFEIPVNNFEQGVKFYNYIFGIEMHTMEVEGSNMGFFPGTDEGGVGGAIVCGPGYKPSEKGSVIYISFQEDINNILSKVTPAGGEVIVPPKTAIYGKEGKFAMFLDPEGNRIGILRNSLK